MRLRDGAPVEPLVPRAAAGECVQVILRNRLPETESRNGLPGACEMTSVGSKAIGNNPLGFVQGGQESWNAPSHFEVVSTAGGGNAVPGDYLSAIMPPSATRAACGVFCGYSHEAGATDKQSRTVTTS